MGDSQVTLMSLKILMKKKKNKLVTKLKKNFDSKKIKYELVEVYIYKNIEFFSELEKEDFLNLKFDFFSYI